MGDSPREVAFVHARNCRECERPFSICCGCDRGHVYGSDDCRNEAGKRRRREASARHRKTAAGRENNARHQREHRERRRRVSDPSSAQGCPAATLTSSPPARASRVRPGRLVEVPCDERTTEHWQQCVECRGTSEWSDPWGGGRVSHARCRDQRRDPAPLLRRALEDRHDRDGQGRPPRRRTGGGTARRTGWRTW